MKSYTSSIFIILLMSLFIACAPEEQEADEAEMNNVRTLVVRKPCGGSLGSGGDPQAGERLFKGNCAPCHRPHKRLVGPPLQGMVDRYPKEWIYKFVKNSAKLIASGDSLAIAVFERENQTPMTAFPTLSDKDIDDIFSHVEACWELNSTDNQSTQ